MLSTVWDNKIGGCRFPSALGEGVGEGLAERAEMPKLTWGLFTGDALVESIADYANSASLSLIE